MLTLVVALKSETLCEPELVLFAGMNGHLHAAGLLDRLRNGESTPKNIWEAIQTLFLAMNEVQELVASRFGSKTRVVFTSSPDYASMPPAPEFVYAMLMLIAEGNASRMLMTALNCDLEQVNLRLLKSEVAAMWAEVSLALKGFYEMAYILILLDEVLCLEVSILAQQLQFKPEVGDNHPVITKQTASLWFRIMDLTITSSTSRAKEPNSERTNVAAAEKQM